MKLMILFCLLFSSTVFAGLRVKRTPIYVCMDMNDEIKVNMVFVYKSKIGATDFFELEIIPNKFYFPNAKSKFERVTLTTKYDGNIETYARGTLRMKIHKALPTEQKYRASAYIPQFQIHHSNWTCKDL